MGTLIQGKWEVNPVNSSTKNGEFKRQESSFRDYIVAGSKFDIEKDRYHLYVSLACPWAHRTLITRELKGLNDFIPISIVSPKMGELGWSFINPYPGATGDHLSQAEHIKDIYLKARSDYTGKATVPVLWDKKLNTIVNNESADIIEIFNSNLNEVATNPDLNLRPEKQLQRMNELNDFIYEKINNGVYKSGFATSQEAYDKNVSELFQALDQIEKELEANEYLLGNQLSETDIRLFTTLIRFDIVYYSHFKCNIRMIRDFKNLYQYMKRLYETPEINSTINFDHIKSHYYWSQESINPTRIVPIGPKKEI